MVPRGAQALIDAALGDGVDRPLDDGCRAAASGPLTSGSSERPRHSRGYLGGREVTMAFIGLLSVCAALFRPLENVGDLSWRPFAAPRRRHTARVQDVGDLT
jgi:hypothetical protein